MHARRMSHAGLAHAQRMPNTCPTHVQPMLNACPAHVLSMSNACQTHCTQHAQHMSTARPTHFTTHFGQHGFFGLPPGWVFGTAWHNSVPCAMHIVDFISHRAIPTSLSDFVRGPLAFPWCAACTANFCMPQSHYSLGIQV